MAVRKAPATFCVLTCLCAQLSGAARVLSEDALSMLQVATWQAGAHEDPPDQEASMKPHDAQQPPTIGSSFEATPVNEALPFIGDPYVTNLKGERFDILQPDYHSFLVVPRGADEEHVLLHVRAKIDPLGPVCSGQLYITGLVFTGEWLGAMQRLEFTTNMFAALDAQKAIKIKAGTSPDLTLSQFTETVPQALVDITQYSPKAPQRLHQHVDTLLVKLTLGPCVTKVRLVYQREKVGFSTSMWITTTGLKRVQESIGGILGMDDHDIAARKPEKCFDANEGEYDERSMMSSMLISQPVYHPSIHASAFFDDDASDTPMLIGQPFHSGAVRHNPTSAPLYSSASLEDEDEEDAGSSMLIGGSESHPSPPSHPDGTLYASASFDSEESADAIANSLLIGQNTPPPSPKEASAQAPLQVSASFDDEMNVDESSLLIAKPDHDMPLDAGFFPGGEMRSDQSSLMTSASFEDDEGEER